jgi:hypothetical protein
MAGLTPGITRRGEPTLQHSLADESRAVRSRVHAVVRRVGTGLLILRYKPL